MSETADGGRIVVTNTGSQRVAYLDGAVAQSDLPASYSLLAGPQLIGKGNLEREYLDGQIYGVMIYGAALTTTEVAIVDGRLASL
jgi:hypothetical protein